MNIKRVVTSMKMNLLFLFFSSFFIPTSFSFVASPALNNGIPLYSTHVSILDDDLKNYQAAEAFLLSIENEKDFNLYVANEFILSIVPICEKDNLELKFKSKVCTTLAKLHGKIADKLRLKGIQNGKALFHYIKKAIQLDPENSEAVIHHAEALLGVYDQGPLGRVVAEKALGLDLNMELREAKLNLERAHLTANKIYNKITDAL